MTPRKITVIREVTAGNGVGERVSHITYDEDTGFLIRPDERLTEDQIAEWDRVMEVMQAGEDLRGVIDGIALLDHCGKH